MESTITQQEQSQVAKRFDIHHQVTDTIIKQLEAGTVPWFQPWQGNNNHLLKLPENFTTGNKYRGINILLLWSSAINNDFESSEWATFKQWQEKKEFIRKGEKGSMVVYYDTMEKEMDGELKKIPFLKSSIVFNKCQLASYKPETSNEPFSGKPLFEAIDPVEDFVQNTGAIIEHKGSRACYIPSLDKICMPEPEKFISTPNCTATEGYYSTLMHELTHWSGNPQRMNRKTGKKFGDNEYAFEELVAELGAAFLCAEFNLSTVEKGSPASYIDTWLKIFKDNKHFVIAAASEASKAATYLQELQPC